MDALFVLLSAFVLAFTAVRFADDHRVWVFDVAADGAVCVAALARRRHPLAAPIVGLATSAGASVVATAAGFPSEPGGAALLALMVLGFTAVRVLPSGAAAAVAVCGVGVAGVGRLGAAFGYSTSHAAYRFGVESWVVAVALGLWLRYLDRRRREAAEAVRSDERLAMARELHDVVAHHITGIILQTQAARIAARRGRGADAGGGGLDRGLGSGPDRELDGVLEEIEAAGSDALTAMRRVVSLLRDADDAVTTGTGPEDLAALVERFGGHGQGPAVTLRLPDQGAAWPPEVASTVYRVVQESLTNIARHATHAQSASVEITRDAEGIRIAVTDDAPTVVPRSRPLHLHRGGFGLVGMRERVEALGGTLDAGPQCGSIGWAVTATLPVTHKGAGTGERQ